MPKLPCLLLLALVLVTLVSQPCAASSSFEKLKAALAIGPKSGELDTGAGVGMLYGGSSSSSSSSSSSEDESTSSKRSTSSSEEQSASDEEGSGEEGPSQCIQNVCRWVKGLFRDSQKHACRKQINAFLRKVGLLHDRGQPELSFGLLKPKGTAADHIDKVCSCAEHNTYLVRACDRIVKNVKFDAAQFKRLEPVVVDAVCHSVFLDSVVRYFRVDWRRAKHLLKIIETSLQANAYKVLGYSLYSRGSTFENIKLNTIFPVMEGTLNILIKSAAKPAPLDPDTRACGLRKNGVGINIMEAIFYDLKAGMVDNAIAGTVMVATPNVEETPGLKEPELTREKNLFKLFHARPSHSAKGVDEDGNRFVDILVTQPLPDLWADLYGVWNLAFTSREFLEFPRFWAKLLTPLVLCHRERPGSYMFYRGVNLALHIISEVFNRYDDSRPTPPDNLRMLDMTREFGAENRKSAMEYLETVDGLASPRNPQHSVYYTNFKTAEHVVQKVQETCMNGFCSALKSLPSTLISLASTMRAQCFT